MKQILKIFFLLSLIATATARLSAQNITVSAPSRVEAGENFKVVYTINTQDVDEFRSGLTATDVVDVIAGPHTSTQSSFTMTNGHTSSSSSITYTYVLYAVKAGNYNVPAAHAKAAGKAIESKPLRIEVVGSQSTNRNKPPRMHGEDADDDARTKAAGERITGNDLFVKVSASRQRVHEQEPVLLTYKVYTQVSLTQLNGKMPDLTGFHTQEIPLPQQKNFHVENVNGKNYRCVTWSQYVVYPQMTGKLEIPSITFKGVVVQQNRNVDPFEAFFNGGSGYIEVQKEIKAPSVTIQVDPLPDRPANFSGGVGKMNISAQTDRKEVKAGEAVTMRVVVGGSGNLKLMKQPEITLPNDFDKYDPKVTDKTKLTVNGLEGNMIYDFIVVPRNQGDYTIPPVELVYYDTSTNKYNTVKTQPISIKVKGSTKGNANVNDNANANDTDKATDIKDIKRGKTSLKSTEGKLFGSGRYLAGLLLPLLVFAILVFLFRKRAIERADLVKMRGRKANRVAAKRLKKARRYMEDKRQGEFYDEVLRTLWGYVSDKLNMPVERLSRENIEENLLAAQVDAETVASFITALDECEFERYAPGDASGNMSKTFASAEAAIMDIEKTMRKNKKHK